MRKLLLAALVGLAIGSPAVSFAREAAPEWFGIAKGWPLGPGQPLPILQTLTLSSSTGTTGSGFSATISGATSGSSLALTNTVGSKYSLSGFTLSGTGLTAGTDAPAITETLSGAVGSPRLTIFSIVVSAPSGGQFDGSDPAQSGVNFLLL